MPQLAPNQPDRGERTKTDRQTRHIKKQHPCGEHKEIKTVVERRSVIVAESVSWYVRVLPV